MERQWNQLAVSMRTDDLASWLCPPYACSLLSNITGGYEHLLRMKLVKKHHRTTSKDRKFFVLYMGIWFFDLVCKDNGDIWRFSLIKCDIWTKSITSKVWKYVDRFLSYMVPFFYHRVKLYFDLWIRKQQKSTTESLCLIYHPGDGTVLYLHGALCYSYFMYSGLLIGKNVYQYV